MKKKIFLSVFTIVFTLSFFTPGISGDHSQDKKSEHKVHWGYKGDTGPEHWGDLSTDCVLCKTGKKQCPVNIDSTNAVPKDLGAIEFNYNQTPVEILNNGHTIQVNNHSDSSITVAGNTYTLLQFHFHTLSENTLDNKHFDMEMHLVHKNSNGQLAVVGVFLKKGEANKVLGELWKHLPVSVETKNIEGLSVNPVNLLPENKSYFYFEGSLTTPPCTEGVSWFVIKNPISVSEDQVKQFFDVMGYNYRPVQPINGRTIYYCKQQK